MDNSQNLAALKQAILGAQAIQAPTSSLGASQAPELANLYRGSFQLPQSSAAAGAAGNISSNIVAEQEAAAKRAAALAQQKQEDATDPSKYRQVKKADGGYDFFDPDGNQIDIATLSQRTKTTPAYWVKDSENPIDVQYLEDQTNMNDYIKAILSKDKKKVEAYRAATPGLSQFDDRGGVDRLIGQFKKSYQRYYTPRSENPRAWGAAPPRLPVVPSYQVGEEEDISI